MKASNWIHSAKYDILWFIFPQLIPALCIFFISNDFLDKQRTEIFPISWLFIVLAIDVAHVYSTVYKTYFKEQAWAKYTFQMKYLPFIVWIIGVFIHTLSSYMFWSLLAYFAVFHFVRQQYGFFRLYSKPNEKVLYNKILSITIYSSTIVPILIWHSKGQQNFNWMLQGDFKYLNLPSLVPLFNVIYVIIHLLYIYVEYCEMKKFKSWNIARIFFTFSTSFAWYACIVMINNDFTFSLVNVLGHGIPYLALVWITEKKDSSTEAKEFTKYVFSKWGWIIFYLIVFIFAYIEEGIWDATIWREHSEIFGWLYNILNIIENQQILCILVPLLIMPQVVHYILDAYIWKKSKLHQNK